MKTTGEQICDWLEVIEEKVDIIEENCINCHTDENDYNNLKKIQELYGQLALIRKVKSGKCKILGFNQNKLKEIKDVK